MLRSSIHDQPIDCKDDVLDRIMAIDRWKFVELAKCWRGVEFCRCGKNSPSYNERGGGTTTVLIALISDLSSDRTSGRDLLFALLLILHSHSADAQRISSSPSAFLDLSFRPSIVDLLPVQD